MEDIKQFFLVDDGNQIGFPMYIVLLSIIAIVVLVMIVRLKKSRKMNASLLVLYVIGVLAITLFARNSGYEARVMINPFHQYIAIVKSIYRICKQYGIHKFWRSLKINELMFTEIMLNVILFVPLGILLPSVYDRLRRWWIILIWGIVFSLIIETIQIANHLGCFDIADLMHNSIGAVIGYFIFQRWLKEGAMGDSVGQRDEF